jgi:large subunit ribosomal protein L21
MAPVPNSPPAPADGQSNPAFHERQMGMYAIIDEGGHQFKVTAGDRLRIDRHAPEAKGDKPAKSLTFERVLLVGGEGKPRLGTPTVAGATVTADILGEVKGKKITIQKYKRRKGYHKKIGHRQRYLEVRITAINV